MLLLVSAVSLHGQVSMGAVSGTITDSTGAAVPGASVTITNQGTSVSHSTKTDASGFFSFEDLSVGDYSIDVSTTGFQESVTRNIHLDPGQRRANNVVLQVGAVNSKVTVAADAEQVNTQTSESGGTLSSAQISNLMLNGRNFETVALAVPGVSSYQGSDQIAPSALGTAATLIVNGLSSEYTTYTIDGMYDMDSGSISTFNVVPVIDGISEFSVLKDNYSAKYGLTGGGQVVVVTKSGTDTFHGSAWNYLRNNAFDANNYFSTTSQPLHQNIYGYMLGGPVIIPKIYNTDRSKKTFFFALNQWYSINAGQVSRGAVFTPEMRNGDFTASPTLNGSLTLDAGSQALLASQGKTNCIAGPRTLNPRCFDPVAVALMNAYVPLPNNPQGGFLNYINEAPTPTSQVDYQYRIDHSINANNLLTARFMYEPIKNGFPYNAWSGLPYSTQPSSWYQKSTNMLLRLQSTITPHVINTVSLGQTEDREKIALSSGAGTMPAGVSIVQAFPDAPRQNLIPNINIAGGWTGNGVFFQPITASDGEVMISDDASWVKGNHTLQAGAFYMWGIKRQTVFTNPEGTFSFSGVHTGDPAADYLLGLNSTYSQTNAQNEGYFHYHQVEAYLQDDWRVSRRLVLNLGVRYFYFSNETVDGNQVTSFNPALYDPAQAPVVNPDGSLQVNSSNQPLNASGQVANLLNGLAFAGKNGVPTGFYTPKKNSLGPRVGFAYALSDDGKTSIRGGYGIGYTREVFQAIYPAFGTNPPFNQTANVLNSLLSNGTAGTAASPTTQTLYVVPFDYSPGQLQTYSLTLERELRSNMVASLGYIGSQGRHLQSLSDVNFPLPVIKPSGEGCLAPGQGPSAFYQFDPCINSGNSSADYTRPYKGYSSMTNAQTDEGSSNYNSLQANLSYRPAGGSQFSLAYTYSKALSTIAGEGPRVGSEVGRSPQDSYDLQAEYGPPSFDFTNNITATWVYNIPFFKHSSKPLSLALGNWSLGGLALHQSGFALTPQLATSTPGLAIRPNQVAPIRQVGKVNEWFDTSSFGAPSSGFFGDASNGSIRGPGYTAVNVALYKTFPITERFNAQFRAEAFNVMNHPNFVAVDTAVGSGSYGQLTSAGDPRILEFAIKLSF